MNLVEQLNSLLRLWRGFGLILLTQSLNTILDRIGGFSIEVREHMEGGQTEDQTAGGEFGCGRFGQAVLQSADAVPAAAGNERGKVFLRKTPSAPESAQTTLERW